MATMAQNGHLQRGPAPEGISSLLDTDLYKLTMQNVIFKCFKDTGLGDLRLQSEELAYLRQTCTYLSEPYLQYLSGLQLRPSEQVICKFTPLEDTGSEHDVGDLEMRIEGLWVETILYEIPLLALTSEAYFKFVDIDWTYEGQREGAMKKGIQLMESGCIVSEFGSRRRRDFHTHELVLQGLMDAQEEAVTRQLPGRISGTSNVRLARQFGLPPVGTMAHEWFMGVAAITNDYPAASETALRYWITTFGQGILGIALTDTFGTPQFFPAFTLPIPKPAITAGAESSDEPVEKTIMYAEAFAGTRQDSGDPLEYIQMMRYFYDKAKVPGKKTIIFSDSLNVEKCIKYKEAAEKAGFQPSFGVGTFFTNDFTRTRDGARSKPLNIVIKLSSAAGNPAVKISDNAGKNTGDAATVARVKRELGYVEHAWQGGDERARWAGKGVGE